MFWGVTLENGKRYSQVVNLPVHISMASLDPSVENSSSSAKAVSVMIDHEKSEFVLCTLIPGKVFQQPLDLQFAEGEEVILFLNGQGTVHLTGYVDDCEHSLGGPDMDDSDEDDSIEILDDEKLKAMIRAKQMKEQSFKRKAVEQSQRVAHSKQLRRSLPDEEEGSSDESDDESDEIDDEGDEDSDDDDEFSEGDSDDGDLFVKTPIKEKGGPQSSPGKGAGLMAAKQKQPRMPPNQQQTQKQPLKQTPKTPGQPGQTPKGKSEQTPKGQPGQMSKGKPGQTPKKAQGKQQPSSPKTPTINGNESLNETDGSKKKRKRNRKNKSASESPNELHAQKNEGKKASPKTSNSQKLPGGIIVQDLKEGNGPVAKAGKFIHVYYTGRLANGNEFDSCKDGKPFKFRLGSSEVIKGWDTGLQGMKVGGTRKITVPPGQGYGNKTVGTIPPNSTLSFDVRLVAVS